MGYLQFAVLAVSLLLLVDHTHSQAAPVWTYSCLTVNKTCHRTLRSGAPNGVPLDVCKLNCNPEVGNLFPLPTGRVGVTPYH